MKDMAPPSVPRNIGAEQALLGAILINNEVMERIAGIVAPEHFFDPLHARIFDVIRARVQNGDLAAPRVLAPIFADDASMKEVGGAAYLVRLAGAAVTITDAADYARDIREKAGRRALANLAEGAAEAARDMAGEPTDHICASLEAGLLVMQEQSLSGPKDKTIVRAVHDAMTPVWEARERKTPMLGVSSGIPSLDRITGGWKAQRLYIIGGRPSMGKSGLAISFAHSAAQSGHGVLIVSREMSEDEISYRMISAEASSMGVATPYQEIEQAQMDDDQAATVARAAREVAGLPIRIAGPECEGVGDIAQAMRRAARSMKGATLDLVVIDYLGLIKPPRDLRNKVNEIGEITQALKGLSRRMNVPIILLSQLSREVEKREDKRPNLSDLRDSGSIEQDADAVMFVFREEYYLDRQRPENDKDMDAMALWEERMSKARNVCEVHVAKNRGGRIGMVKLFTDIGNNVFKGLA